MIRTPVFRTTPLCGRGAGPGSLLPRVIGVDTVRPVGDPIVDNNGISNSNPRIAACNPNEVSVVQLRRPRSAHDTSSRLSANMASSSRKSLSAAMDTTSTSPGAACARKKGRVATRPWRNFSDTRGVGFLGYFGGSLGFGAGVAGFGVAAPGTFTAGFVPVPVPVEAGAATPDCTL